MLRDPLFRSHTRPTFLPGLYLKPFLKKKHRLHPGTTQVFGDPSEQPGPKPLTITPLPSIHLCIMPGLSPATSDTGSWLTYCPGTAVRCSVNDVGAHLMHLNLQMTLRMLRGERPTLAAV